MSTYCDFCTGIYFIEGERCPRCGRAYNAELDALARRARRVGQQSTRLSRPRPPHPRAQPEHRERPLTHWETEKLREYGCVYPWRPWDMLLLIYRLEGQSK